MQDESTQVGSGSNATVKSVVCTSCDGFCPVSAKVEDGRVVKIQTRDHPLFKGVLCMKGAYAPKQFSHPDRILYPLKRVGERCGGQWEQVSWDEAMDDIAVRLQSKRWSTNTVPRHWLWPKVVRPALATTVCAGAS